MADEFDWLSTVDSPPPAEQFDWLSTVDSPATATLAPPSGGMGDLNLPGQSGGYFTDTPISDQDIAEGQKLQRAELGRNLSKAQQEAHQAREASAQLYESDLANNLNRSWPVQTVRAVGENIFGGGLAGATSLAGAAADVVGAKETTFDLRDTAKAMYESLGKESAKREYLNKTQTDLIPFSNELQQAVVAVADASLAMGRMKGVPANVLESIQAMQPMAAYFGAKRGAETYAETGSKLQGAVAATIDAGWVAASGPMSTGVAMLAGADAGLVARTAGRLAERFKLPKVAGEIAVGAGAQALQQVGQEATHYLADVGFGRRKWDRDEFLGEVWNNTKTGAVTGGLASGVHSYITQLADTLDSRIKAYPAVAKAQATAETIVAEQPEVAQKLAETDGVPSRREHEKLTGEANTSKLHRETVVEEVKRQLEEKAQPEQQPAEPPPEVPPEPEQPVVKAPSLSDVSTEFFDKTFDTLPKEQKRLIDKQVAEGTLTKDQMATLNDERRAKGEITKAPGLTAKFDPTHLPEDLHVTLADTIHAETGERISSTRPAHEALRELEESRSRYKQLFDCLQR